MTIKWFQLVGGSGYGESGRPVFSSAVSDRAWEAFPELEGRVLSEFEGARWLLQGGYERVAVGLEFRTEKKGRQLRTVTEIGRLISVDYSVVWPELQDATVDQIRERLMPIVVDALELVGEKKALGHLPRQGLGDELVAVPLKPLIDDPAPYADVPGDSFVVTRELPADLSPAKAVEVLEGYEADLDAILSRAGKKNVIEAETSSSAVRWVIQVPTSND
ncbi:hypothetical protein [Streptomyces sp. SID13031]|uniref:hypothetical protein n=1 Tax=Streptomyces sp. SID13031 TaxID=2706046 RepID=UPI0019452466|nr:hypothetical protein [Streptomyces sp. SID13031]